MWMKLDQAVNELGERPEAPRASHVTDLKFLCFDATTRAEPSSSDTKWQLGVARCAHVVDEALDETLRHVGAQFHVSWDASDRVPGLFGHDYAALRAVHHAAPHAWSNVRTRPSKTSCIAPHDSGAFDHAAFRLAAVPCTSSSYLVPSSISPIGPT